MGGGVKVTLIPWQYFFNGLTLFMKMISYPKNLIILVPSSYFPILSQFHYPSLLNDIQVWDINTWKKMKMDINNFEFICLPTMDEFHPMIYLFNSNHKWHSSKWNHYPCRWIKIMLNFKFKVQSSSLMLMHKPSFRRNMVFFWVFM